MRSESRQSTQYRMPAEWEPHDATWIAWPHEPTDWPGKLEPIRWVYAEIVRVLGGSERVEILALDGALAEQAKACLDLHRVDASSYRIHVLANDRGWLRDAMPTGVLDARGGLHWIGWRFSAWAKYDNFSRDAQIPKSVASISGAPLVTAVRPDSPASAEQPLVLEGGAIEVDGEGTLLTTEECLLSSIQERNPGLSREGYEESFARYLGVTKTIWLGSGCAGDDTHGHIDDIARFVAPGRVVLSFDGDSSGDNHESSADNLRRLQSATDAAGRKLEVVLLPMPRPIWYGDERLPASYANFYIGNKVVIVPTFNDPADRIALNTFVDLFPGREIVGIHATDLVLGQGTLHCLSQQQPRASAG